MPSVGSVRALHLTTPLFCCQASNDAEKNARTNEVLLLAAASGDIKALKTAMEGQKGQGLLAEVSIAHVWEKCGLTLTCYNCLLHRPAKFLYSPGCGYDAQCMMKCEVE